MFSGARAFNRDLSGWDTGNVTNMQAMFDGATQYNGNMINWRVNRVTDMSFMFRNAVSFDNAMPNWTTASVVSMESMFEGATLFGTYSNIGAWDLTALGVIRRMFKGTAFSLNPTNRGGFINQYNKSVALGQNLFA